MSLAIDELLKEIYLGRQIADDMLYDYFHPNEPRHPSRIHETRADGMNERSDSLVGAGFISRVLEEFKYHPIEMCRIFSKSD